MKRARKFFKKYFIPHEENNHKPHILRPRSVAFVLVVAVVVEGALLFGTSQLAPRSRLFGIVVANTLIDETNQNRVAANEAPLTVSPLLEAAAQDKVEDMVENDYFAHTSPSGITPWYWFEQVGYNFEYAGENLAVDFSDSADVTNAWMNSPEHRANILNANYTQIGMATATGTYNGAPAVYVVEEFGTPVPAAPPAEAVIPFVNSAAAAAPVTQESAHKTSPAVPTATVAAATSKKKSSAMAIVSTTSAVQADDASSTMLPGTSTAIAAGTAAGTPPAAEPSQLESNPVQTAAANPRAVVNDIYLAIIILFALALGINIFVKIRVQHPQVIFGGMLVILVAGLLIVLNQHVLVGAAIL